MRRVAQLISGRGHCRCQRKKETHTAQLGSHTQGDRETARSAGSRRSRQRERRNRSQGNTERFAIAREQRQRLAAFDGRATGGVSGSRPRPAPTLARTSPPARRSPNRAAPHPEERDGAIEEIMLIENIESVCLLTRHSTEKAEVKGALLGETSDCCRVFVGQRTVLDQKRGGVPASYERQVATRLADPSALQR